MYWRVVTKLYTYPFNSWYTFCYRTIINVYVLIIIIQSVLPRVHILLQNDYSTEFDTILPLSRSRNCLCISPFLATFVFYSIFPSKTCFRTQFLHKMWPVQLNFLCFILGWIFFSSLTFSSLMTYIYIYIYMCVCVCVCVCVSYRTANLQKLHFIYLFNKYTYWIF